MKNNARRFNQKEYELLRSALRSHEFVLSSVKTEEVMPENMRRIFGDRFVESIKTMREDELRRAQVLRERLDELYHHDIDWLENGAAKWCLACKNRHEPHCPNCAGCLPEELPE